MRMSTASHCTVLLALLLATAGCGDGGPPATFELTIRPVPPPSQPDLFEDIELLVIRLTDASGEVVEHELDVERGTSPAVEDLGALPEGVTVELLGYGGSGDAAPVVARGISDPLDVGRAETTELEIFMAATGEMATFYELDAGGWDAAVASDGEGRFFVFGGAPDGRNDDAVDTILSFELVPPASDFAPVAHTTMPVTSDDWAGYTNEYTVRAAHTATLLAEGSHGDVGKILVAGGWSSLQESRSITLQQFLFDPHAEPDDAIELLDGFKTARAQHKAVALPSGNVVLFGGYGHLDSNSYIDCVETVEVYNAESRSSDYGSQMVDHCMVDGAAAVVGDAAMHCGGTEWASNNTHEAWGDCVIVDRFANVSMVDGPSELNGAGWMLPAMASMGGDQVMVTGGVLIQGEADDSDWLDPTDRVFAYNGDNGSWSVLPPMNVARAGHVATALPGGRVLVAGGAASISNRGFDVEDELPCAEVYDPSGGGSWSLLDGSCQAGSDVGSLPTGLYRASVATDPYWGTLIWSGLQEAMSGEPKAQPIHALFVPEPD